MKKTYPVVEIFESVEGEGIRTGSLTTFIRLKGCNLRCSYCDTKYAQEFVGGEEPRLLTISEIMSEIKTRNVTVTGGEPLMCENIDDLLMTLSDAGMQINVETNGSIPIKEERICNVFYTIDYKCPSSGQQVHMHRPNFRLPNSHDVIKFVVGSREDLNCMVDVISQIMSTNIAIFVSPVFGHISPESILRYLQRSDVRIRLYGKDVRLQIQLHKIIWDPNKRGV